MVHEVFDIEHWCNVFSLAKLRKEEREFALEERRKNHSSFKSEAEFEQYVQLAYPKREPVTSPIEMAVFEQLRLEEQLPGNVAKRVPCDVFVFAEGEPPRRDVTKVGGLPYWPRNRKWPTRKGKPMAFVAQLNFADSRDLVQDLPSNLLLVFTQAGHVGHTDPEYLQAEWVEPTDALVESGDIPATGDRLSAAYGVRHRTWDLPIDLHSLEDDLVVDIIQATKIGGLPPMIQDYEMPERYIGTIGSVHPHQSAPFPFINVPAPLNFEYDHGHLMWGDVGAMSLSLSKNGSIIFTLECF